MSEEGTPLAVGAGVMLEHNRLRKYIEDDLLAKATSSVERSASTLEDALYEICNLRDIVAWWAETEHSDRLHDNGIAGEMELGLIIPDELLKDATVIEANIASIKAVASELLELVARIEAEDG